MSDDPEIISLLREIRDLHRAHLDYYKEFTAQALQRSEEDRKVRQQSIADAAQARKESREFREQTQRDAATSRRSANRTRILLWTSGILNCIWIVLILYFVLAALFHWWL